jgi:hypothetical protein
VIDERTIADEILQILVSGSASDAQGAERLYLERHVDDVARLALEPISETEFRRHPLIRLLMMQGSRSWEDSLT